MSTPGSSVDPLRHHEGEGSVERMKENANVSLFHLLALQVQVPYVFRDVKYNHYYYGYYRVFISMHAVRLISQ